MRVIAEAQDDPITRRVLDIALSPLRSNLLMLKWAVGLNAALCLLILGKLFDHQLPASPPLSLGREQG